MTVTVAVAPARGVAVLMTTEDVLVAVASPGAAVACASGQASRSTGKSVQVVPFVQMLSVRGVISGPLQRTTCLPLFTSTVLQVGVVAVTEVEDVVEEAGGEVIVNVAVSGITNRA